MRLCDRVKTAVERDKADALAWIAPSIERVFTPEKVVHAEPLGSSRHGKYKDPEARKAYRRAWYKAKRAQPPNP